MVPLLLGCQLSVRLPCPPSHTRALLRADLPNDAYWAEDRVPDPIVIIGFGDVGQAVANMLDSPLMGSKPVPYVIFDLTPGRVQAAQEAGFNVLYGEGSRRKVGAAGRFVTVGLAANCWACLKASSAKPAPPAGSPNA